MSGSALPFLPELSERLTGIVREAGARALQDFRPGAETSAEIVWKEDHSPVTGADLALDRLIGARIAELDLPGVPPIRLLSEERPETWTGDRRGLVAVLDPIDGTRAFMKGRDDWCIALGLAFEGEPVAGILHVPARDEMFVAYRAGGARLNGRSCRLAAPGDGPLRAAGPLGLIESLVAGTGRSIAPVPHVAALAHRLARPVAGDFDLGLARAGGRDWDLVAADCILREAGGLLLSDSGARPIYAMAGGYHPGLRAGARSLLEAWAPSHLTESVRAAKGGAEIDDSGPSR